MACGRFTSLNTEEISSFLPERKMLKGRRKQQNSLNIYFNKKKSGKRYLAGSNFEVVVLRIAKVKTERQVVLGKFIFTS